MAERLRVQRGELEEHLKMKDALHSHPPMHGAAGAPLGMRSDEAGVPPGALDRRGRRTNAWWGSMSDLSPSGVFHFSNQLRVEMRSLVVRFGDDAESQSERRRQRGRQRKKWKEHEYVTMREQFQEARAQKAKMKDSLWYVTRLNFPVVFDQYGRVLKGDMHAASSASGAAGGGGGQGAAAENHNGGHYGGEWNEEERLKARKVRIRKWRARGEEGAYDSEQDAGSSADDSDDDDVIAAATAAASGRRTGMQKNKERHR
jgi:hypothetical protein